MFFNIFGKILFFLLPWGDCDDSEAEKGGSPAEYEEVPEPEEEIEFSVEIIERENTETVVLLYRPRRTIGADSTLAYLGEYLSYLFLQVFIKVA